MTNNQQHDDQNNIDEISGVETTGHEWDGIEELNNPLPRWWLILFYVSIFWAIIYCIFMPSFPGLSGLRNHSDRQNVAAEMSRIESDRAALATRLLTSGSLTDIEQDPDLFEFAMAAGLSAFGDNCATCHGVGGQGFPGYPNLADDVWLWGGTLNDIQQTITYGIRAHADGTRQSLMPAFGEQGLLTTEQINDLTTYVVEFSASDEGVRSSDDVAALYNAQCAACHGIDGTGDRAQGAPDLTDSEWLYGSDRASIRQQIITGRNGVMPNWGERLDDATIAALSVYVHALGGGELEPANVATTTGE